MWRKGSGREMEILAMFPQSRIGKIAFFSLILVCAILFSILTVYLQYTNLGLDYLEEGHQIERHLAVLQGNAGNPWQYRVLADYVVEGAILFVTTLNVSHPLAVAFLSVRFIQNVIIFLLAYSYYRRFGLSAAQALIGISLLAWGMTHAYYDSDLQFSNYFDIIFYLLTGWLILINQPLWLIPVMALAALNRETSGLIPFMLLASHFAAEGGKLKSKTTRVAAIAFAIYLLIFIILRLSFGPQELFIPYGHPPGKNLLKYNLLRTITWVQLFATLGILPLLAVLAYRTWPHSLKAFFWVIIPIWFIVHMFASIVAETRLFLVPQAVVFIPGALFLLKENNPGS